MKRVGIWIIGICKTAAIAISIQTAVFAQADPAIWQQQVIYLVMPDRFYNGNPQNDRLGTPECFDPTNIRRFHGGDWTGLQEKVDYLKDLGVTAVWSTPVYKQIGTNGDACGYHGYWPDFTYPDDQALEPKLGTDSDLLTLITTLQANQMKFIMDMVINHAGPGARLTIQKPDWFHPDNASCTTLGNPDIYCKLADLPDLAQENPATSNYLLQQSQTFVQRFPIDGIRMDTVKHVETRYFRNAWIPAVRAERQNLFLVGEALYNSLADSVSQLEPYIEAGFDSMFNFPLRAALEETFARGKSVDLVASRVQNTVQTFGQSRSRLMTNLLDNHDMPRFVNQIEAAVGSVDNPANAAEIRQRYHMALAILFALPGIPQIYYGNELGMFGANDPFNRRSMPAWAWNAATRRTNPPGAGFLPDSDRTFRYLQSLIRLRKMNSALHSGYYAELYRQNGPTNPDVYAFFRGHDENRVITIVNNGTLPSGAITIPIQVNSEIAASDRAVLKDGTLLEELLSDRAPTTLTVTNGAIQVDFPAKTVGIYRVRL